MTVRLTRLAIFVAIGFAAGLGLSAQESPRTLFESGMYQAVVDQTPDEASAEDLYVEALSYLKLGQNDQAKADFGRLDRGGEAWRLAGQAAIAAVDGNLDGALEAANAAVAADGGSWGAQYQLGQVLEARGDNAGAAEAFVKATEANPLMAYAHYNAGMNYYKVQRVDRMAVYFENFLKLAPKAPEWPAVESIMRTLRGR